VAPAGIVVERSRAYNGGRIVAEFNGAGTMTARFVYGTRPQGPDTMIEVGSGQVYRLLTDHLGSVRLVVRLSDGAIVQQLAYDPWGDVETDTKPGFQPFGFAGGLYDPDTRLVRFGARDYDPAIGRWTAKDPSGFAGGSNLYAYANNDPVNLVDLTGENPVFFMLAGAMRGIGEDILFQMVVQGKRWGCLDGQELAMAGVLGALTGGLGAPAARGAGVSQKVANQANHIFGVKNLGKHKLGGLLDSFGGDQIAAFQAIETGAQRLADSGAIKGIFVTAVKVGEHSVTVRRRVIDGIVNISTAFIP
jgi:RHS repeat-associated protein